MTADNILAAVYMLNRGTAERARRLACAISLLRAGVSSSVAASQIRARFGVGRTEAWYVVDMAKDVAGVEGGPT